MHKNILWRRTKRQLILETSAAGWNAAGASVRNQNYISSRDSEEHVLFLQLVAVLLSD